MNQSVSHASDGKLFPLVIEGNASKYFSAPAGEAKFDSDCVAKRQNSSNADDIDLIKCWGKYNSWNSRNTNPTKCTICGKFENREARGGVGCSSAGAVQGDE